MTWPRTAFRSGMPAASASILPLRSGFTAPRPTRTASALPFLIFRPSSGMISLTRLRDGGRRIRARRAQPGGRLTWHDSARLLPAAAGNPTSQRMRANIHFAKCFNYITQSRSLAQISFFRFFRIYVLFELSRLMRGAHRDRHERRVRDAVAAMMPQRSSPTRTNGSART
ncbi:hypothetical protein BRAS3843_3450001 [Bradyrhizobium sp. STM 3843]|nr:hypothetical protein BRAS3843_3450001 [Bradyrhizobium sp. STM 3843]